MKIKQTSSRTISLFIAAFMFSLGVRAEIFLGSNTSVNSLVVASNEVILISATRIDYCSSADIVCQISWNGTTQSLAMDRYNEKPSALAGPATLTFPSSSGTNSLPVCICFQRIQGTTIQSLYVPSEGLSAPFQVPAGKTCHVFWPISDYSLGDACVSANIQTSSNAVNNLVIMGDEEFPGPATLTFNYPNPYSLDPSAGAVVSFYLTDDSLNLPAGVLQGPTGSFAITVEKSTDLKNWSPTMIQSTGESHAAFYRLNFSH